MKTFRRIALIGIAGLLVFLVDRNGWPVFVLLGVWVAGLVLAALVAERRGYPKPLLDLMVFGLISATVIGLAAQGATFLWEQDWGYAAVFALFILILVKASLDFLGRKTPGSEKRSVVLSRTAGPPLQPRQEIS